VAPSADVLAVGRVRRPHGVHGEVLVDVETDFPDRLVAGTDIGLGLTTPSFWMRVLRVRLHKNCWLLTVQGVRSRDEVEGWRDHWVFLPEQDRSSLPDNYYYEHELAGLNCVSLEGDSLGRVRGLAEAGGGALLNVETARGDVLVPFRSPIVVSVRLAAREVVLDPPAGLFDDDAL
jgi:16S rRNA processing protein RimM